MADVNSLDSEQARYWNEAGGRRWAANIERVERMLQPLAVRLLDFAAPRVGEAVLDVGCGGGPTSHAIAAAVAPGGQVLGVDVSAVILDIARARFSHVSNLKFALGDAGSMPLVPNTYDVITSRFGVMFFPDAAGAFAHLRPSLKSTGRLRFICWRDIKLNPWMGIPAKAAFEILPRPAPLGPHAPGPFAFADDAYLRGMLMEAGFRTIEITPHDAVLDLGTVDDAVEQMTRMGPAAPAFDEADPATRALVMTALRGVFEAHVNAGGTVRLPSATWLVAASPA
jgi:SAM-dependent methyltransferase